MASKTEDKIGYLRRMVWLWVGYFSKVYTHSDVLVGRKFITIKMWSVENGKKKDFDDLEFPIKLLGRTIATYRKKIRNAFKARHNKSK